MESGVDTYMIWILDHLLNGQNQQMEPILLVVYALSMSDLEGFSRTKGISFCIFPRWQI